MCEKKVFFLADNPNQEDDSFQIHSKIAETLFDIITKHNLSDNSFTVGLFGEWGSGKSFIINKLAEKIKEKNITFINIDVWKYSGQPLLRSILFELDKQFKSFYKGNKEKYKAFKDGFRNKKGKSLHCILYYDEVFKSESKLTFGEFKIALKRLLSKFKIPLISLLVLFIIFIYFQFFLPTKFIQSKWYGFFKPILNGIASFGTFIGAGLIFTHLLQKPLKDIGNLIFFRNTVKNFTEKANFSPEQFESIFKNFLSKIKDEKYVIVFDNIDRCEPSVAYETLSTIKTFMDVKNCFYIIPADDDAIKNYLSNFSVEENRKEENNSFRRKFAEEFIDKIFQTYIRIPILKEVDRDDYIKKLLMKIDFKEMLSDDDIQTITQILYFAYKGESPRNIIRFINDYSTYFQLSLKSLPQLLDNIMLFTIMVAIKQKWYFFEKTLLENPDFFEKYPNNKSLLDETQNNNTKDLKNFLESIQSYYIPKIKNISLDEYIYFKKSEKSFELTNALKNNQPENIELNNENIKILIREFDKLVASKGQFAVNSFITFAKLIKQNEKSKLYQELVTNFWYGFIKTPQEQIKLILEKMTNDEILISMMNSLNNSSLNENKVDIETKIITYFKEPIKKNNETAKIEIKEYENVFETMISSEYKFSPTLLKKIFNQWEKGNQYLNSLLKIISKKEKEEYLPENILTQLVDSPIDNVSIELLKNWNNETIPKPIGIKLSQILLERIKQRNFANYQLLIQHKPNIEMDYELILLLDISFVEASLKDDFINSLTNLTNRIFQYANNNQPLFELAVEFWIELSYFSDLNKDLVDTNLFSIFNQHIKANSTVLQFLSKNINYSKNILSLPKTKRIIFNISPDIQWKLYEKLNIDSSFTDFDLITSYPINQNHIEVLLNFLEKNKMEIDKNKLSHFLMKKIIDELINDKVDILEKLNYLKKKFKIEKQLIIDNKNGIIDFSKEKPEPALNVLKEFKMFFDYNEFFNTILKPILNFIKSELEASKNVEQYTPFSQLLEDTNNKEDIELLFSISKICLEKNQTIKENYFGIDILETIYQNLLEKNKNEINKLIKENDHFKEWNKEHIEKLVKLGIIKREIDSDTEESQG